MTDDERQAELDAPVESIEALKAQAEAMVAQLSGDVVLRNVVMRAMADIVSGQIAGEQAPPPPFDPDPDLIGHAEGNRRETRRYQRAAQRMREARPAPLHPSAIKPMKGNPKATVTPRRIGYTVHRTGLMIPERDRSWHLTRKGADRAVRRWVEG